VAEDECRDVAAGHLGEGTVAVLTAGPVAGTGLEELAGLGRPLGIVATDDVEAIITLAPDCVLYMPLHPDVEHLTRLLGAGINVLTTASFLTGRAYGEAARAALDEDHSLTADPSSGADRHREAFAELEKIGVTYVNVSSPTRTTAETLDFVEAFGSTYLTASARNAGCHGHRS
jgi:hypothetical protein